MKKGKDNPQLRRDPAFLREVENVLGAELRRAAPAGSSAPEIAPQPEPIVMSARPAASEAMGPAKAAAKPPRRPSASDGRDAEKVALVRELEKLLPRLDQEGLAFLLEQAKIHLYNMGVAEAMSATGGPDAAVAGEPRLSIKAAEGGASYHLVYGGKWKFFTAEELLALVRIAQASEGREAAGRLYRLLKAERADVFGDFDIDGPSSPLLLELVGLLRRSFAIRGEAPRPGNPSGSRR